MKRLVLLLIVLLSLGGTAFAVEVAGVKLAPELTVKGQTLHLNGYGIRKKFFFKIYVGSLYTASRVASTEQALAAPGAKLIRMDFLYHKVDKEKIIGAFAEGFAKNSPQLSDTEPAKAFLRLFDQDFVEGDQVDLIIGADGTVSARHNGRDLGSVTSRDLARGVLLIYLGKEPADEDMKEGMLGRD
ncbi:MAG: chalcone isomerase family protein [Geothermobacteraceae bacterium]